MTKFHDKVEGRAKQIFGQAVGDQHLVWDGTEQIRKAELKPESDDGSTIAQEIARKFRKTRQ